MTPITEVKINPISNKLFREAVNNSGWTRNVQWPVDALGEYGANTSTDEDLDAYVYEQTGVQPGGIINTPDFPLILSACAGRDNHQRPIIRLSVHRA